MKTYVVRPGGVLARDGNALVRRLLWTVAVRVDELAAVMVDVAVNGWSEQLVESKVIIARGRELLIKQG